MTHSIIDCRKYCAKTNFSVKTSLISFTRTAPTPILLTLKRIKRFRSFRLRIGS